MPTPSALLLRGKRGLSPGTITRFRVPTESRVMARPHRSADRRPLSAGEEEASNAPRIIGGDLRGRSLEFTPAARTRPMKDRVRESHDSGFRGNAKTCYRTRR
ncbi:MAG: RsmD family RNA methyltransferase [Planctomycetia bacterium]